MRRALLGLVVVSAAWAQEAGSGLELRSTLTGEGFYADALTQAPRNGDSVSGGFRGMLYPVWKWNQHWSVEATVQVHSRPYFTDEFSTQGFGVRADILQAHLNYTRFWKDASLTVRAGELSTAFGSFLLRYDDMQNPLVDVPVSYGYYGGTTLLSLAGVQVDASVHKFDARAQFVNSSPANRRSIFDSDQYGSWAGGVGYTIAQGFRVGASVYRGPYLDRHYPFYFPGEAKPRDLPGTAVGIDVAWGRGPWNVCGEWQRFQMDYEAIPTFHEQVGYGEVRRVLSPRWYLAERISYLSASAFPGYQVYETAVGYRPGAQQLVKVGYEAEQGSAIKGTQNNVFAVQYVIALRAFSFGRY
ncbi:MAG TPA: hypothetical protein VGN17_01725 [Bryobacteraceae bacterium]|jgi:hypothetical protein